MALAKSLLAQLQTQPVRGSSPDGLESLDSVLALLQPTPPNPKPAAARNWLLIAVGGGAGSLAAGAVKEAVKGALSQSMGGMATDLAADTVGEVAKAVVSGLFERLKAQSETDEKINLLLVEPLDTAKRHIREVFLADWDAVASSQRSEFLDERNHSLRLARDQLLKAQTTVSNHPDLLAKVEALLTLTYALVPTFKPFLEGKLKLFRDEADKKVREANVSEWVLNSSLPRRIVCPALTQNLTSTSFAPKSTWTTFQGNDSTLGYLSRGYLYSTAYFRWAVLPLVGGLLIGIGSGLAGGTQGASVGFIISKLMTDLESSLQTTRQPLVAFENFKASTELKASELRESAARITRYCGLLAGIADKPDDFFRVIRKHYK